MSRKARVPAAERKALRETTAHHPGEILSLTKSASASERKRRYSFDKTPLSSVVAAYRRQGIIQGIPEHLSRLARISADEHRHAVLPMGQLVSLYNSLRTPEDRDAWIAKAAVSLDEHECTDARCLCGRVRRLAALLIDSIAVENKVTPWLPDPRYQVPGSACGNER